MGESEIESKIAEAKFPLPIFHCRNCLLIWLPSELADLRAFYEENRCCPKCGHDGVRMRLAIVPQRVAEDLLQRQQ